MKREIPFYTTISKLRYNMNDLLRFMTSSAGRGARIAAGLALAGAGLARSDKPNWLLVSASLVPLSAGLFDWCLLGPLTGKPFEGASVRKVLGQ
jgi:hypothetical protein